MARRIANSTLNASTIDILNVIRQNASYDYQQNVPEVATANDIPKVGEVIYGTPAFANQFINALVNRIAIVRVQSATFNNPYTNLKKGYLSYLSQKLLTLMWKKQQSVSSRELSLMCVQRSML